MEVLKQCQICGQEVAKHTCKMCGALVGDNCFDAEKGICTACGGGKQVGELLKSE